MNQCTNCNKDNSKVLISEFKFDNKKETITICEECLIKLFSSLNK